MIKATLKKYIPKKIFSFVRERWLNHKYGRFLEKNRVVKDKYLGKRCFVVGNGPSLEKMDLLLLADEKTFVLNEFFLHKDFMDINPEFYSIIEPMPNQYFGLDYFDFMFSHITPLFEKNQKMNLFFNLDYKGYLENKIFFKDFERIFYLKSLSAILDSEVLQDDISNCHSFMDASIYNAICCAAYLGFKSIYLIGCDFDHILNKTYKHFYDEKQDPLYDLSQASNLELAQNLHDYLSKMEKISKHFKGRGVEIYNAGIGGLTDVFPRVDFKSLFQS